MTVRKIVDRGEIFEIKDPALQEKLDVLNANKTDYSADSLDISDFGQILGNSATFSGATLRALMHNAIADVFINAGVLEEKQRDLVRELFDVKERLAGVATMLGRWRGEGRAESYCVNCSYQVPKPIYMNEVKQEGRFRSIEGTREALIALIEHMTNIRARRPRLCQSGKVEYPAKSVPSVFSAEVGAMEGLWNSSIYFLMEFDGRIRCDGSLSEGCFPWSVTHLDGIYRIDSGDGDDFHIYSVNCQYL